MREARICGLAVILETANPSRFEAVKKPRLENGLKSFSQLEALQAIIRTSV
jgi:hypothetical protein